MSYVPPVYVPSREVELAHAAPRFSVGGGMTEDNSWNFTSISDVSNGADYALGVVVLPGVLIVAGLVSIFFFNFFLICRCCCSCLKCAPNEVDITENPEKVIKSRHRVCFFFFFFLLLMVLADHLLYYGNADIDAGADNLVDAADRLKLIFNSIIVQTANINSYTAVVDQILTVTNTCKDISGNPAAGPMADMSSAISQIGTQVGNIGSLAKPVPGQLDIMSDFVSLYLKSYKQTVLFVVYCVALAMAVLYLVGYFLTSKFILIISILVSELLVLLLTILCGVLFIIITFYGDFCMQPIKNLRNLAPGESLKDIVSYFGFCTSTDPFAGPIAGVQSGIGNLTTAINAVGAQCNTLVPAESDLWVYCAGNTSAISTSIGLIGTEVTCEPLNKIFTLFINDALCTNAFGGLYKFWLAEYSVSASLFFVMIMTSVMWQYFGEAWHLKPLDQHTGEHGQLKQARAEQGNQLSAPLETAGGYKQEYTFTAASPSAPPVVTKKDIEMI